MQGVSPSSTPPHRGFRGEEPPAQPFPGELSPPKPPSIFQGVPAPIAGGFGPSGLAWERGRGTGPSHPGPTPTGVIGTQGFRVEAPRTSAVLGSGTWSWPRREAGRRGGPGRTEYHPQLPLWLFLFVLFWTHGPVSLSRLLSLQKSCPCSLPCPVPREISYHCCICNLWIRGLSIY